MGKYISRLIDKNLNEWSKRTDHKPLLLRGARQVGKSTAVRHLGEQFDSFVEINFEKQAEYKSVFTSNLDVKRIITQISAIYGESIIPGKTLLFLDEIQECPQAIMALRYFKEDLPQLHVIAAGSPLEFALEEIPTFGVGRIHSMFMYPLSFNEFLGAVGEQLLAKARDAASPASPLAEPLHAKLVSLLRTFMLVGGMPEAVAKWADTHDYLQCQEIQDDIVTGYEADFPKYRKKVDATLLRKTLRSCAIQAGCKFVYARVDGYKSQQVKSALEMLTLAGIVVPVTHTPANGIPLGNEADANIRKYLIMDTGLLLRLLNLEGIDSNQINADILTLTDTELTNKGPLAEMLFGLEYLHYLSPSIRHDLYYWVNQSRNSLAEVDYVTLRQTTILPIEVKVSRQGGMKSLWAFMAQKKLKRAVRCSLENFGHIVYFDAEKEEERQVDICPLYAVSSLVD